MTSEPQEILITKKPEPFSYESLEAFLNRSTLPTPEGEIPNPILTSDDWSTFEAHINGQAIFVTASIGSGRSKRAVAVKHYETEMRSCRIKFLFGERYDRKTKKSWPVHKTIVKAT